MKVLGIDPGSRKAGFGLIEVTGMRIHYLASGTMRYNCKLSMLDRLADIYQSCTNLIEQFGPDEVAIESLIHVKNVNSLAKLAQARGAMIAAIMKQYRGKVFEYSPTQIKASVTGHGLSDKIGVQKIISMMLGNINFSSDDESDALAIAICHALAPKDYYRGISL